MIVSFLSFNEKTKTAFQTEAELDGKNIIFEDKSIPNTKIKISKLDKAILLERFGQVKMKMLFCLEEETKGTYINQDGLEFEYSIQTKDLLIQENKIKVSYILYMDHEEVTETTFQVSLFQKKIK